VPAFYAVLQEQDFSKQVENTKKLQNEIAKIVDACDSKGPFFLGPQMTFVDIQMAPWMIRCPRVLKYYRGWPDPEQGSRWASWMEAIENNEHVKATTSANELYIDSYERYAHNRPGTSQLADAINSGNSLP
jgi:glutathione S-transferase